MSTLPIKEMSIDELEALKQEIDREIKSKETQTVDEAFQKVRDLNLNDDDLRKLGERILYETDPVRLALAKLAENNFAQGKPALSKGK
jgi:hypothetical protein